MKLSLRLLANCLLQALPLRLTVRPKIRSFVEMAFVERLAALHLAEKLRRAAIRLMRMRNEAKLPTKAAPEELIGDQARGFKTAVIRERLECSWIPFAWNVLISGETEKSIMFDTIEIRSGTLSTTIIGQRPDNDWHGFIDNRVSVDATLDRLSRDHDQIKLRAGSLPRREASFHGL